MARTELDGVGSGCPVSPMASGSIQMEAGSLSECMAEETLASEVSLGFQKGRKKKEDLEEGEGQRSDFPNAQQAPGILSAANALSLPH